MTVKPSLRDHEGSMMPKPCKYRERPAAADALLTCTEVAALLRVSEQTVYRMARAHDLPGATRVGNSWRFDPRRLDAALFAV